MKYYRILLLNEPIDNFYRDKYVAYNRRRGFYITHFVRATIFTEDSLNNKGLINFLSNYEYKLIQTNNNDDIFGVNLYR